MKKTLSIFGIVTVIVFGIVMVPMFVRAQEEVDPGTTEDIISITERAEDSIMNALPQGVKDFFTTTFQRIEAFRLQQVATATVKRDELHLQLQNAQQTQDAATDENRDEVLEGESTSLYEGAGDRLPSGSSIGLTVKYYAYKFYVLFVSSPIMFYLLGSFVIVYIIGTLFNRARRRGE